MFLAVAGPLGVACSIGTGASELASVATVMEFPVKPGTRSALRAMGAWDPYNVTEAVRLSGAPIVDVSSGVERGAGLKDPALIEAFLRAAARA